MAVKIDIRMHGMRRSLMAINQWGKRSEGAVDRSVKRSAQYLRKQMVQGIRSQAPGGKKFKPLADSTKAAKGSSKALIDNADMIRSINVQKVGSGKTVIYFVGVHRNVVTKDGSSMANLAEIHETGSLKVKDRPPARPFMLPSWNVWIRTAQRQFAEDVANALGLEGSLKTRITGQVTGGRG